jgi:hypothetical protein
VDLRREGRQDGGLWALAALVISCSAVIVSNLLYGGSRPSGRGEITSATKELEALQVGVAYTIELGKMPWRTR